MLAELRSCSCTDCTKSMDRGTRESVPAKTCKNTMVPKTLASSCQRLPLPVTPGLLASSFQALSKSIVRAFRWIRALKKVC